MAVFKPLSVLFAAAIVSAVVSQTVSGQGQPAAGGQAQRAGSWRAAAPTRAPGRPSIREARDLGRPRELRRPRHRADALHSHQPLQTRSARRLPHDGDRWRHGRDRKHGRSGGSCEVRGATIDVPMRWRGQGGFPAAEYPRQPSEMWTGVWVVPADAPPGALSYTVTATDRFGRTATFSPFINHVSQLTIVE